MDAQWDSESLPVDVLRMVFELAAETRADGLACAMVSMQVKTWCVLSFLGLLSHYLMQALRVEPTIYRDVIVDSKGLFHRTVTASDTTKPPDFFAAHVKSLLFRLDTIPIPSHIPDILYKCTSVKSLAMWVESDMHSPELQAILTSDRLEPTRLSLPEYLLGEGNAIFAHPIFRRVTHLDVLCASATDWTWGALATLENMTHLNIELQYPVKDLTPYVTAILSECPRSLRTLVLSPSFGFSLVDEEVRAMNKGEIDPRVVVASGDPHHAGFRMTWTETQNQWGRPSTTSITLWSRADDFIRKRQKREVVPETTELYISRLMQG